MLIEHIAKRWVHLGLLEMIINSIADTIISEYWVGLSQKMRIAPFLSSIQTIQLYEFICKEAPLGLATRLSESGPKCYFSDLKLCDDCNLLPIVNGISKLKGF